MAEHEAIAGRAVQDAIVEINSMLEADRQIDTSPQTALVGGSLDSLTLINLIVAIEEHLEDATGASVSLADKLGRPALAEDFATVGSLTRYLGARLGG